MINNKSTIIFDFDGTLVDTMQIFADVASHLISENYGIEKEEARRLYFKTSGLPFKEQLEIIFPNNEKNAGVALAYEAEKNDATQDIKITDESFASLQALKNSDYDLIISSNNFQYNIDNFVINNELTNFFALQLGFRDGFGKGRDHFGHIKNELGVDDNSMLFIGDSLNDYKLAKENKIDFIGKIGTFSEADFHELSKEIRCIRSISELI